MDKESTTMGISFIEMKCNMCDEKALISVFENASNAVSGMNQSHIVVQPIIVLFLCTIYIYLPLYYKRETLHMSHVMRKPVLAICEQ